MLSVSIVTHLMTNILTNIVWEILNVSFSTNSTIYSFLSYIVVVFGHCLCFWSLFIVVGGYCRYCWLLLVIVVCCCRCWFLLLLLLLFAVDADLLLFLLMFLLVFQQLYSFEYCELCSIQNDILVIVAIIHFVAIKIIFLFYSLHIFDTS